MSTRSIAWARGLRAPTGPDKVTAPGPMGYKTQGPRSNFETAMMQGREGGHHRVRAGPLTGVAYP
jgi:hypothetical protein